MGKQLENSEDINTLSANFTKWSNTETIRRQFECVWPFLGLVFKGLRMQNFAKKCFCMNKNILEIFKSALVYL